MFAETIPKATHRARGLRPAPGLGDGRKVKASQRVEERLVVAVLVVDAVAIAVGDAEGGGVYMVEQRLRESKGEQALQLGLRESDASVEWLKLAPSRNAR
jgi:hypothetical protein